MTYDLQSASSLFHVPIEIRRAIYADLVDTASIHITLSPQGRVRLTRCLDPDLGAGHLGDERRPPRSDDGSCIQTYCRRLASTWGPHWGCEEIALANGEDEERTDDGSQTGSRDSFLTTCKRLYFEVGDWMREQVRFQITDLATAKSLFKFPPSSSASIADTDVGFRHSVLPFLAKLGITMNLPLLFFQALSTPDTAPLDDNARIWLALPRYLEANLPSLRVLRIWLDHSDKAYWSAVNERAVLRPFEPLVPAAKGGMS
ncbi:hypothetical protein PG993_011957 [Apiospora rasikravindrae]|uniref:DUF7730 domain-containing protein n=1 Tax=Apiospora rasikravindrae TaxID=990691 RepID=A0ABR1S125_9PEZI